MRRSHLTGRHRPLLPRKRGEVAGSAVQREDGWENKQKQSKNKANSVARLAATKRTQALWDQCRFSSKTARAAFASTSHLCTTCYYASRLAQARLASQRRDSGKHGFRVDVATLLVDVAFPASAACASVSHAQRERLANRCREIARHACRRRAARARGARRHRVTVRPLARLRRAQRIQHTRRLAPRYGDKRLDVVPPAGATRASTSHFRQDARLTWRRRRVSSEREMCVEMHNDASPLASATRALASRFR